MSATARLACLFTATALLAACGGGDGGPSRRPASAAPASTPSAAAVTVTSMPPLTLSAVDCPRLTSEAASIAALDLTDPNIRAINELLLAVDPAHAHKVFIRRPNDFINWIVSSSGNGDGTGTADTAALGVATHETLHMTDSALAPCMPGGQRAYQFFGSQIPSGLAAGSTAPYGIVAQTIDPALQGNFRYTTYIADLGAVRGNDFRILLDEFAAYTGAAHTELQSMAAMGDAGNIATDSNLGGTVNFMVFVQNYLRSARLNDTASYDAIRNSPAAVAAIQAIWSRAESVLQAGYPRTVPGSRPRLLYDSAYFQAAYSAPLLAELDAIGVTHATAAAWSGTYLP